MGNSNWHWLLQRGGRRERKKYREKYLFLVNRQKRVSSGFFPKSDIRKKRADQRTIFFLFPQICSRSKRHLVLFLFLLRFSHFSIYDLSIWPNFLQTPPQSNAARAHDRRYCVAPYTLNYHLFHLQQCGAFSTKQRWQASTTSCIPRRKYRLWKLNVSRWTCSLKQRTSELQPSALMKDGRTVRTD